MEFLLTRYRNLSVLLVAILLQLGLLAYQIKSNQDVRLIRVWAVSAVTPMARVLQGGSSGLSHFFHDYFALRGVREENQRMKARLDQAELENQYLRAQLSTADRASALAIFRTQSQSKTVAAHVTGNTTDTNGTNGTVVIVDRGSSDGIQKGMAVITPEGIVGQVISVYPPASYVRLITDPAFGAGVISQQGHVQGTLKGKGGSTVNIDYIENEEKVEQGEWFYTSGTDGVFPRGLKAGQATIVRPGKTRKEIILTPSGLQGGLEDVLIVIDAVHGTIPDAPEPNQAVHLIPPPPDAVNEAPEAASQKGAALVTDLDRIAKRDKQLQAKFGDKNSPPPNFNAVPDASPPTGSSQHP
ncbi:MAG TPA: rod shape-determining protein MreC [Bryobacteraceae bacterium]|jgi:rod shape-determining protein MreC